VLVLTQSKEAAPSASCEGRLEHMKISDFHQAIVDTAIALPDFPCPRCQRIGTIENLEKTAAGQDSAARWATLV